ncbi:MAG TPA: hypothetical protein DD435_08580 [Cyanobacteria bacterium UBA8530]|nr:hypothetical protein [Cyanobacteria bacterium UBA8530]
MNETIAEAAIASNQPQKKKSDPVKRVFLGVVGKSELDVIKSYSSYYPRFDLVPLKPLPTFLHVGVTSLVLGGAIGLIAFMVLNSLITDTQFKAEELKSEIAIQRLRASKLAKAEESKVMAEAQLKLFKVVDNRLFKWSSALDIFRCLTPYDVRLTSLTADSTGQLLADGQSNDLASIGFLMLNLRGSGLFFKPKLFTSVREDVRGRKVYRFTFSSELLNPASVSIEIPQKKLGGPL